MIIAGAGGAAHLPGHGRREDDAAGARRPGRVEGALGDRLAPLDRADAGRRPGRDARDRPRRRGQRRAARRCDPRRSAIGGRRAPAPSSAPPRRRRCSTAPTRPRDDPPQGPMTLVACIGGGQLGRMLGLAGLPLGLRFRFLDPAADACAASVGELVVGEYGDPDALARLARRRGRRHLRVRERAGRGGGARRRGARASRRSSTGRTGCARRSCSARSASPRRASATSTTTGVPGARQDAAPRLRRQGTTSRRARPSRSPRTSSPRSSSPSTASSRSSACAAATATRGSGRSARTSTATGSSASPAHRRADAPQREAEAICAQLLDALDYVGVLAVELFEVGGRLLANEFAPRVHNTGHWTIDGAVDEPVREPPARDPRPAARRDRGARADP